MCGALLSHWRRRRWQKQFLKLFRTAEAGETGYSLVNWRISLVNIKYDLFIVSVSASSLAGRPPGAQARGWNSDAVTTVWRGTNDGSAMRLSGGSLRAPKSRFIDEIGWISDAVTDCGARAPAAWFAKCVPVPFSNLAPAGIVLNTDAVTVFGSDGFWAANWSFKYSSGKSDASIRLWLVTSSSNLIFFNWSARSKVFAGGSCSARCSFSFSDDGNALNASNWLHEYISFSFNKSLEKDTPNFRHSLKNGTLPTKLKRSNLDKHNCCRTPTGSRDKLKFFLLGKLFSTWLAFSIAHFSNTEGERYFPVHTATALTRLIVIQLSVRSLLFLRKRSEPAKYGPINNAIEK